MNRITPPAAPQRPAVLIEALEPRIAPAGFLNESKFTSVAVGGSLLLDASGAPGTFQGLTTGSGGGSGSYLLYVTSGRALVFTTDINGNGILDPGEITGIALGKDSLGHDPAIILFSDVNGDIVTNLDGTKGSNLTDSDHNPTNGRNGQLVTDTNVASITIRTLTTADIDSSIPGNTVLNRLALTSFSIHGNVDVGGNIGAVSIDTTGTSLLTTKFNGSAGDQLYTGATPQIGGLYTGTATNNQDFHFTQNNPFTPQVQGTLAGFHAPAGEHGGDISNVSATSPATVFSIGTLATGDGGTGARGGNLTNITMHGDTGSYQLLAGNGGDGATGGQGGSITGFNDLGTVTGEVILHTGDGGTGLLGSGGAGGLATFQTPQIAAGVQVLMGRGGDGFTNGGTGASFTSGTFNTPETLVPFGSKFYGTWHDIGDVGSTHPLADGTYSPEALNFNPTSAFANSADALAHGDNYGDGVFTTSQPDQIIVVFGDGAGGLLDGNGNFNGTSSATVTLKVPGVVNPVVAFGDFNGDGRVDIAVASGDVHNFSGIYVFFNQIGTSLDPINSKNYTHSLVGDNPFSAPHQTALPTLAQQGFYQTSGAVVALTTGDFNGDGLVDIAYVQNLTAEATFAQAQTVEVLLGISAGNDATGKPLFNTQTGRMVGSGYFYANTAAPRATAQLLNDTVPGHPTDQLVATSLTTGNLPNATTGLPATPDVFVFGSQGALSGTVYSLTGVNPTTHVPTALAGQVIPFGQVDTNRNTGPTNISLVDFSLQQFTVQDIDGDGNADIVALSKTPLNFLVVNTGNGTGGFGITSGGGDNAGLFLGNSITSLALTASDSGSTGVFNTVAVLTLPSTPAPYLTEVVLTGAGAGFTGGNTLVLGTPVQDLTVTGLDGFYTLAPDFKAGTNLHPTTGYGVLSPESTDFNFTDLFIFGDESPLPTYFRYETANGYAIQGGDGGNAVTGVGGNAGVIGTTTTNVGGGVGAITITFPQAASYEGQAFLHGGNGGNGFAGGGIGGDVTGIAVRYAAGASKTSDVEMLAGNGGNGTSGDGGRGGNISQVSVDTGTSFTAGNGGTGLHGGAGGSITGNQSGTFDTSTATVTLLTGTGASGALGGGTGGSISNWDTVFTDFVGTAQGIGQNFGLIYTTGAGGGAAGGNGGNGGSILNSSPDSTQNNLSGVLTLQTGAGGDGLSGGNGGAINTFNNISTNQSAVPSSLTVLTGHGGIGVSGAGGTGGAITNFTTNATGLVFVPGLTDLVGVGRIIAGDGGTSYGNVGGIGGTITKVVATTTSTPLVVAGGAGGNGLTVGGAGGAVTNSTLNSAALQIGKLLIVAGKGGDAFSAQPQDISLPDDANTGDLAHAILAFGGTRGIGGDGGNVTNITQPVGAQTAVDVIAGNGGSTPNASTALTADSGVGRGGSVTNLTLTGTVGAVSRDTTLGALTNPPIQAYAVTDSFTGTSTPMSISAIIDTLSGANGYFALLGDNTVNTTASALSSFIVTGNVGIVAGASGTVRAMNGVAQPAQNGVNGGVTGITAQSILSIVAGSVNSVAPVRILSGITLTSSDGVLGADRSATAPYSPNGVLDYYNPTLGRIENTLTPGDSLIDGALYASTIQQTSGNQLAGPRVIPATAS